MVRCAKSMCGGVLFLLLFAVTIENKMEKSHCHFYTNMRALILKPFTFLAVQDSSKGDLVTHSLSHVLI